jgi:hypothetical protein
VGLLAQQVDSEQQRTPPLRHLVMDMLKLLQRIEQNTYVVAQYFSHTLKEQTTQQRLLITHRMQSPLRAITMQKLRPLNLGLAHRVQRLEQQESQNVISLKRIRIQA